MTLYDKRNGKPFFTIIEHRHDPVLAGENLLLGGIMFLLIAAVVLFVLAGTP